MLARDVEELADAQELLWASDRTRSWSSSRRWTRPARTATIKHVMSGVNPQGVPGRLVQEPSAEELDHNFLWRIVAGPARAGPHRHLQPLALRGGRRAAGAPGVARRPAAARPATAATEFWDERYEDINAFERHLDRNGTKVVKFFLHVSKAEQKRRFLERLDEPDKEWKFNAADVAERARWDDYMEAYETALTATSTRMGAVVRDPGRPQVGDPGAGRRRSSSTRSTALDLQWPEVSDAEHEANVAARRELDAEDADTDLIDAARG